MKARMYKHVGLGATAVVTLATALLAPGTANAATPGTVRSWSAGTMSAGQSKSYTWNNANSDVYQVNTGAVRTSDPNMPCAMEVTKQSYRLAAGGSRQFVLTIRNNDSLACDVTVYLAPITADRSGATGAINPGQSKAWRWNNANGSSFVYFAGVTPSAPGAGTCQLEVTWRNRVVPSGEQEFVWTVRNIGSAACDGTWRLGWLPVSQSTTFPPDDDPTLPGNGRSLSSPVDDPFRVYFFNMIMAPTSAGNCEWGPRWLRMEGDPSGPTAGARTDVGYANIGPVACVLSGVTVAYIV